MPSAHRDDTLRGALYDRTGMNFFACEIDGVWRGGWFRIDGRTLEVSSETQSRSVTIVDPDLLTELLRKVLTDIVHEPPAAAHTAEPREGQALLSAFLRGGASAIIFLGDPAEEREQ